MSKNIIICCDGTNNQFAGDHTNVIRTYKVAQRTVDQSTFYDPGVGTMPEPWRTTNLGKRISLVWGLVTGSGFLDNVEDAYRFLMANYLPGDKVFLFGFSRGAYTARALAGMLHSVGLLFPGTENLIRYAQRYWRRDFGPQSIGGKLCAEFKKTLSRECPVHFIGVWDTVSSVGIMNNFRTFPHTMRNPSVAHVRHAVSLDERRKCFRQNLIFPAFNGQDIKNVWFAGVHSDVGGGYPKAEAGLAKLAFDWMVREAQSVGMLINFDAFANELDEVGSPPNPQGMLHRSLKGAWWLVELIPNRRYSFEEKRWRWHFFEVNTPRFVMSTSKEPDAFLHKSVLERMERCPEYKPVNIPADRSTLKATFQIES